MVNREIDKLIASKLLNLTVIDTPFVSADVGMAQDCVFTDAAFEQWRKTYPRGATVPILPRYSENVRLAWLTAEDVFDNVILIKHDSHSYVAEVNRRLITDMRYGIVYSEEDCPSAARALCVAMLRAYDIEVEANG